MEAIWNDPKKVSHMSSRSLNRKNRSKQRIGWLKFEEDFVLHHPDFLKNLLMEYPFLSTTEMYVCAMIRSGLPSREIANILGISERTVENHRTNIRRKISLNHNEKILSFFYKI